MRKTVFLAITLLLTTTALAVTDDSERTLELALKNYKETHYRKASGYFEKLKKADIKGDKAKFVQYAINVVEKFQPVLYAIEKEEAALRRKGTDKTMTESLCEKHRLFAKMLMQGQFYLPMVEPHLKRAIALDPHNADSYSSLGDAYYVSMQYAKARDCYKKVLSLDPGDLHAYKMAGDASIALGDFDATKKYYTGLIRANKESTLKYEPSEIEKIMSILNILPQTYKDIARLIQGGEYDKAETVLKKRISMNSGDYIAMTELGNIYLEKGDRKNALRLLTNAVDIAPEYPPAHLYLGRLHFLMRDYDGAVTEFSLFKEKIKMLPNMDDETKKMYIDDLYYLADAFFTLEKYKEGKEQLDDVLKLDPKQQDAYHDLGVYYYVYKHDRPKAYKYFMKSIEIDPTTQTAKSSKYNIEFMRSNPDSRVIPDFSFIDREYRD